MKIQVVFEREDLDAMQYPVLVTCWDRVTETGSRRRRYHEAFTEAERNTIGRYYRIFYDWYLRRGTPDSHIMHTKTHELLVRAIDFFASNC